MHDAMETILNNDVTVAESDSRLRRDERSFKTCCSWSCDPPQFPAVYVESRNVHEIYHR